MVSGNTVIRFRRGRTSTRDTMLLYPLEANGRMIAAARMLAGLNQEGLAHLSSVTSSTISNIESGKHEARPETMIAIQKALRMKGVTLINENGLILLAITYQKPSVDDLLQQLDELCTVSLDDDDNQQVTPTENPLRNT